MIPTPEGMPERPDTPDFWVLSDIILKFDGDTSEGGKSFDEVIAEVYPGLNLVDDTVAYMAMQRAFRALGVRTVQDVRQRVNEVALLSALWMEGFTVAAAAHDRLKEIDS